MKDKIEVGSLIPHIESILQTFTKSEKKVARYVLKQPEQVIYNSITDVSEVVGVGDSTIIRFCRKAGFKGYQGFKMALAQEVSLKNNKRFVALNDQILDEDSISTVIQKLSSVNVDAIQKTISLLDEGAIVKAVDLLMNAKRIYFYGVGSSGITAMDSKYKFMRIGLNVDCSIDGHFMAMQASLLNKRDAIVGISYSGSSKDTVETLKTAKEAGAATIAITHHAKSPITQFADIVLLTGSRESPLQGGAQSTKIAQLFVIDILYTEIFRRNKFESIASRKKTGTAIEEKLY